MYHVCESLEGAVGRYQRGTLNPTARVTTQVLPMQELFDYVTDPTLGMEEAKWEEHLDRLSEAAESRPEQTDLEKVSEAVFKGAFIPHNLSEVRLPHCVSPTVPPSPPLAMSPTESHSPSLALCTL